MEEKKDKAYFRKLANQLMFDFTEEESEWIVQEFETITKQLEILDEINTDGVEEMVYPFEQETTYMRKDVVSDVLTQEEVLENASETLEGHFVIPRVVK